MWSLKDENGYNIEPLKFSNNKNQEEIINEIINKFDDGNNLIFLDAQVGSGKSAIALNIINNYKKGIITTPTKTLQDQYQNSYSKKYHIKNLKIEIMKGRNNFNCPFRNCKASNSKLPCIRKLKGKERRWNIASECEYWNPTFPKFLWKKISNGLLFPPESNDYEAIDGEYSYIKRSDDGCPYYNQCEYYTENNIAIIMNSQKWLIETLFGRKPKVDIEIIDEADLFLDQLTFNCKIDHNILELINLSEKRKFRNIKELHEMLNNKSSDWYKFIKMFENILKSCISEYAQSFLFKISLMRKCEEDINVNYSAINQSINFSITKPDKIFNILRDKSANKILLMSATPQEKSVFEAIFKLPIITVQGETKFQGNLIINETGKEMDLNYKNWTDLNFREQYWENLNYIISLAEKPILVNVFSYKYLPDNNIGNIPSSNELKKNQDKQIKEYLKGKRDIIFTTKFDRGVDLKGKLCRSIIMTKTPYPDISTEELISLKNYYGDILFNKYINDLVLREILQNTGRILRNKDDFANFYTMDVNLLKIIGYIWLGNKEMKYLEN